MDKTELAVHAIKKEAGNITVTLSNAAGNAVAFFNRISLVDEATKTRILPTFYSDNYVSVLPGESKTIIINYTPAGNIKPAIEVEGWNVDKKEISVGN